MTPCHIIDLGQIGYAEASALQKRLVAARKSQAIEDVLLFCEHPHTITLGRNGRHEHLLASDRVLQQMGVAFQPTDRGGDITYHGPGQLVGYPILNLAALRRDVVWYVRMLEEVMIRTSLEFGIVAGREPGKTGVWIAGAAENEDLTPRAPGAHGSPGTDANSPVAPLDQAQKLGAIGVHLSRWVTSHGFAYNVSTDMRYFDLIVPCGIAGRQATSLEKLLGRGVPVGEAATRLGRHFGEVFGLATKKASYAELLEKLQRFEPPVALTA